MKIDASEMENEQNQSSDLSKTPLPLEGKKDCFIRHFVRLAKSKLGLFFLKASLDKFPHIYICLFLNWFPKTAFICNKSYKIQSHHRLPSWVKHLSKWISVHQNKKSLSLRSIFMAQVQLYTFDKLCIESLASKLCLVAGSSIKFDIISPNCNPANLRGGVS